jgi:hypothetical protein
MSKTEANGDVQAGLQVRVNIWIVTLHEKC